MSAPDYSARVYVGNINFAATEEELKDFFEGLKVASVEIPSKTFTRGETTNVKRLGFGFVQFETAEDAQQAIEQFNRKEFKSRPIYAKMALPPASEEEKKAKNEAFHAKQKELRAKKKEAKRAEAKKAEAAVSAEPTPESAPETVPKAKISNASKTPEGKKSTDTIFITNLNYTANSKSVGSFLKELKPVWVNVPTRRVPAHVLKKFQASKKPIFNKGIAFVKFADEETQQKAIAELNGKEFLGREILVEAAVDREVKAPKKAETVEAVEETENGVSEPTE